MLRKQRDQNGMALHPFMEIFESLVWVDMIEEIPLSPFSPAVSMCRQGDLLVR
jgi:hypothetical protein